jgi:serine/threonine-protein kinase
MWALLPRPPASGVETRLAITLPAGDRPVTGYQPSVAISPDGTTVVYRASRDGVTQLFSRRLDALDAQAVPGTADATGPFFSPDGRWIGFDGDGVLKRVPLDGGAVVDIAAAPGSATATWLEDDTIVFATNTSRVLQRVPVGGGEVTSLTTLDQARGETLHLLPQATLGRPGVLFTIASGAGRELAWLALDGSAPVRLGEGSHARMWSASQLVFARAGSLWTTTFEAGSPRLAGTPSPLFEGVDQTDQIVFHYDIARDGTLVYLPAAGDESAQQLVWHTRDGQAQPANLEPRSFTRVALSPDANRVAVAMNDRGNTDIWVGDLRQRSFTRLTSDPAIDTAPIWSPDGESIVYRSERPGPGLFRRDAQGAAPEVRLTETDGPIHSPYGWTPDSRTVLFALFRSFSRQAIAAVTPPDRTVRVLLDGEFAQLDPQVSPDGRWLAYQSDETGRFEVYVRPYPDVRAGRWTISTRGATTPRWSPDGRELFVLEEGQLAASRIDAGDTFRASPPARLFAVTALGGRLGSDFEVASDGRFLFVEAGPRAPMPPRSLIVVQRSPALRAPSRD